MICAWLKVEHIEKTIDLHDGNRRVSLQRTPAPMTCRRHETIAGCLTDAREKAAGGGTEGAAVEGILPVRKPRPVFSPEPTLTGMRLRSLCVDR